MQSSGSTRLRCSPESSVPMPAAGGHKRNLSEVGVNKGTEGGPQKKPWKIIDLTKLSDED